MKLSLYEKLTFDRDSAHQAVLKMERRERELARARHELAGLALDLAALKLRRALARKYRQDQPRVPAGNPDGGQWTEGGGTGGADVGGRTERIRIAQNDTQRRYAVNLAEEETRGGHTMRRHVGKSDDEMLAGAKARGPSAPGFSLHAYRHGSFSSVEDANDLTNRALEQNRGIVDEVAAGKRKDAFIKARFGYPTGREAVRMLHPRAEPYMRATYGVGVYIQHDPKSPKGYRVTSAYPRND